MKKSHGAIFFLLCGLYLIGLLLYTNQRDLTDRKLARLSNREGLVARFGHHHKPLESLLSASHQNLLLAQSIKQKPVKRFEPWILIADTARFFNTRLSKKEAESLSKLILSKAKKHDVDPLLMTALISQESAFYETARSPVGAYGYGQLMPETAAYLGVNPRSPEGNLEGCAKYLSEQLRRWKHREDRTVLALASYNAGPGAVAKYNGVPPYRETRTYVMIITSRYQTLQEAAEQMKQRLRS